MDNVIIHASNLLFNGTDLECSGNELRPDGTCAKCERINGRIMAKFSPVAIELLNQTFPAPPPEQQSPRVCVKCGCSLISMTQATIDCKPHGCKCVFPESK